MIFSERRVTRASFVINAAQIDGYTVPAAPEPLVPSTALPANSASALARAYCAEELVAEIASAFLSAELGVTRDTRPLITRAVH